MGKIFIKDIKDRDQITGVFLVKEKITAMREFISQSQAGEGTATAAEIKEKTSSRVTMKYFEGGQQYEVHVRAEAGDRGSAAAIRRAGHVVLASAFEFDRQFRIVGKVAAEATFAAMIRGI